MAVIANVKLADRWTNTWAEGQTDKAIPMYPFLQMVTHTKTIGEFTQIFF